METKHSISPATLASWFPEIGYLTYFTVTSTGLVKIAEVPVLDLDAARAYTDEVARSYPPATVAFALRLRRKK